MFSTMGAEAFAERTRRELLATGAKVRKREVATRDELTPQEEHIARLARNGRTNAEIGAELYLSVRTVEWHLRRCTSNRLVAEPIVERGCIRGVKSRLGGRLACSPDRHRARDRLRCFGFDAIVIASTEEVDTIRPAKPIVAPAATTGASQRLRCHPEPAAELTRSRQLWR
jgi:DNA-binding CsgD family transcriptional regulator